MATHSNTRAWRTPWTEEPGRLQSMGSLRVRHDWATSLSLFTFMQWRRKWQPTPVFLPGESQGWGSLVGWRLWVAKNRTRLKQFSIHTHNTRKYFQNHYTKLPSLINPFRKVQDFLVLSALNLFRVLCSKVTFFFCAYVINMILVLGWFLRFVFNFKFWHFIFWVNINLNFQIHRIFTCLENDSYMKMYI